jgi:leader peptidase (prepilin peptidase)/N-methyltransferase
VGALTIVFFLIQGWSTAFLWTISFVFVMTTITVIDWQHLIIPNKVILAGLLAGSLLILVFYPKQLFPRVTSMVSAAGITALILMVGQLLFKKPVMGMGDVKLAGLVGLFLGLPGFLVAFWLAAIVGALFGLTKHHCQRTPIDAKLPFGSFLASTACLVLVGQDTIINWLMGWLIFLQ